MNNFATVLSRKFTEKNQNALDLHNFFAKYNICDIH